MDQVRINADPAWHPGMALIDYYMPRPAPNLGAARFNLAPAPADQPQALQPQALQAPAAPPPQQLQLQEHPVRQPQPQPDQQAERARLMQILNIQQPAANEQRPPLFQQAAPQNNQPFAAAFPFFRNQQADFARADIADWNIAPPQLNLDLLDEVFGNQRPAPAPQPAPAPVLQPARAPQLPPLGRQALVPVPAPARAPPQPAPPAARQAARLGGHPYSRPTPPAVQRARSPAPGPSYLRDASEFGSERTRLGKDCMSEIKKRAECPVCFEDFQDVPTRLVPRALQCGHLICGGCVEQLLLHASSAVSFDGGAPPPGHISCPVCRTVVPARNLPAIKEIVYFARQHELAEIQIQEQRVAMEESDCAFKRRRVRELVSTVNAEKKKRLNKIKELQKTLLNLANGTANELPCNVDDPAEVIEQRLARLERKKRAEEEANSALYQMTDHVKRMTEILREDPVLIELDDDEEEVDDLERSEPILPPTLGIKLDPSLFV